MARPPKKERGLYTRKDASGKLWWYYRVYLDGREQRGGPYETKGEAKAARGNLTSDHRRGKVDPEGGWQRIDEVIDRHLTLKAGKKDQASQRRFARWWKARCKEAGLTRIKDLTVRFLEEMRDELRRERIKVGPKPRSRTHRDRKPSAGKLSEAVGKFREPGTINRHFAWLRSVLKVVKQARRTLFDDWTWEPESDGRTRYLNDEEEASLLAALGPYAYMARLAILTGLRQAEQFQLQWKDVDLERGLAVLGTTKSGRTQVAHLSTEATDILRTLQASQMSKWQASKWVFPSPENPASPLEARNFYHRVWIPAVKQAGIEWATWHDLRHCFATRLALSGHKEATISSLLRHSTTALVKRYTNLQDQHLKQAVEAVARFGKGTGSGISEGQTGNKPETTGSEGERNGKSKSAEVGVVEGEKFGAPDTN